MTKAVLNNMGRVILTLEDTFVDANHPTDGNSQVLYVQLLNSSGDKMPSGSSTADPLFVDAVFSGMTSTEAGDPATSTSKVLLTQLVNSEGVKQPSGASFIDSIYTTTSGIRRLDSSAAADSDGFLFQLVDESGNKLGLVAGTPIYVSNEADQVKADASVSTSSDVVLVQSVSDDGEKTPSGASFTKAIHTTTSGIRRLDSSAAADSDGFLFQLVDESGNKLGLVAGTAIHVSNEADQVKADASVSTASDVILIQSVSDDGEKTPAGNIFGNAVHTTVSGINKADATADSDTDVYRVQLINELGDKIGLASTEPVFTNTAVSNPPWEQDTYVELADETGGTDGEHDYYIDIEGYPKNCVEYDLSSSVSLALQGTIQNDGTEPESCRYHNVEDLYVGTPTFSGVDAGLVYTSGSAPNFKYLRLRVTAATGDDSGDWFLAVNKFMV